MHTKFSLLLVGFALLSLQTFGQKDYAVSMKGDTIKGKLKIVSYENLDRIQVNTDKKKTIYTALQVKWIVKDGVAYQTVKLGSAFRFLKVIKQGYLSLFAFNTDRGSVWEGRYLLKRDGSGLEVPNLAFRKILSDFLTECPEVHTKLDQRDYSKRELERIVDEYNQCIEKKNEALAKLNGPTSAINTQKVVAIGDFSQKVEAANFLTKKDVQELLADMKKKVARNEDVPHYLVDGLKSYLADTPELQKEADELIALLKKQG